MFRFGVNWSLYSFLFYVAVGLLVSLFCKKAINKKRSKINIWFVLAFFVLFCVEAFRSINVGTDTAKYVEVFQDAYLYGEKLFFISSFEPLFNVYLYLVSRVSNDYLVLFSFNALIKQTAFLIFVKKYWRKGDSFIFLPLFVINFEYDLSAMRSGLAGAFVLISFVLLDSKKYIWSIIVGIAAMLIHYTAVFSLIIVLFRMFMLWRNDKIKVRRLTALIIVVGVILNMSIVFLRRFVEEETKYSGYVRDEGFAWLGYWYLFIAGIISITMMLKAYKKFRNYNSNDIANILVLAGLPIYVVLNAYRIPRYFLMCRNVAYKEYYTDLLKQQKNNGARIALTFISFSLLIILLLFFSGRISGGGTTYEINPIIANIL